MIVYFESKEILGEGGLNACFEGNFMAINICIYIEKFKKVIKITFLSSGFYSSSSKSKGE